MPTKPDYIDRELELIAGRNIFGELNLRIVWGGDVRDHRGNPKYLHPQTGRPLECWVLERWVPPGFFGGKEAWENGRMFFDDVHHEWIDVKGDYPTRGGYIMLRPIVNSADNSFLPLDRQVIEAIRRSVRDDEQFSAMSEDQRARLLRDHKQDADRRREEQTEKEMADVREYHARNWDAIDRSITRGYSITPR